MPFSNGPMEEESVSARGKPCRTGLAWSGSTGPACLSGAGGNSGPIRMVSPGIGETGEELLPFRDPEIS